MTQVTKYASHGREVVANMSLQDLESIDGILAVIHVLLTLHACHICDLSAACVSGVSLVLPYQATAANLTSQKYINNGKPRHFRMCLL
jgi:hypothetical protein